MKASEIDRARGGFRLTALKEKILCLESELNEANKDRDRLLKIADKFEVGKAALTRKDAVIKVKQTHTHVIELYTFLVRSCFTHPVHYILHLLSLNQQNTTRHNTEFPRGIAKTKIELRNSSSRG